MKPVYPGSFFRTKQDWRLRVHFGNKYTNKNFLKYFFFDIEMEKKVYYLQLISISTMINTYSNSTHTYQVSKQLGSFLPSNFFGFSTEYINHKIDCLLCHAQYGTD